MAEPATLTLADANRCLEAVGMTARFTQKAVDCAHSQHPTGRVRHALTRARDDAGARRFLENLIASTGNGERAPSAGEGRVLETPATSSANRQEGGRRADARTPVPNDERPPVGAVRRDAGSEKEREYAGREGALPWHGGRAAVATATARRSLPQTVKVFGAKGALEFREHLTTKDEPTVMLEGALASGTRRFDWLRKVSVQVMPLELPAVAAVLAGLMPRCEFTNHGPQANKGYSVDRQGGGHFVRVFRTGEDRRLVAVPMPPGESYYVYGLVLRQLRLSTPGCDGPMVLAALRSFARFTTAQ